MAHPTLPDWYHHWLNTAASVNDRQVFFIVGCQKSGTTWAQRLLNAHPQIACIGEGHLCDTAAQLLQQFAGQYNQSQSATNRLDSNLLLDDDDLRGFLKLMCDRTLARYIACAENSQHSILAVGDKTPEHANAISLLRRLYPHARIIHVIRDGRDAAVSGWAHLQRQGKSARFDSFAAYAEFFAARHWKPYITNARAAGQTLGDEYLELRYEQLHDQPQHHVRRILNVLGVPIDDTTIQFCIDAASFTALTGGRNLGEEDRTSHFRKGVIGDWQQHFNDQAVQRFEAAAGDLLETLGYAQAVV